MSATVDVRDLRLLGRGRQLQLGPLSLQLHPGALLVVVGVTGSGKTLLLQTLAGLLPYSGVVTLRAPVAMQFQNDALVDDDTVAANVLRACNGRALPDPQTSARTAIEKVGLAAFTNAWPRQLSGGQRRRVGLARAIAVLPAEPHDSVLLLDDPTAGLDIHTARELLPLLLPSTNNVRVVATVDVDLWVPLATHVLLLHGAVATIYARDDFTTSTSTTVQPFLPEAIARMPW